MYDDAPGSPTDDPVHPDLRLAARLLPRTIVTGATIRPLQALSRRLAGRRPAGVDVHDLGDGVAVRVHRPADDDVTTASSGGAMLWMHGGGYVIGSAAGDDQRCSEFARRLGIVVAAVEYRLAPGHPYPVPLQDCHLALEWLARQSDVDADRIILGGASAGGGLAAALALRCRDVGDFAPRFQLLVYPMIDDRTTEDPAGDPARLRVWSPRSNRVAWAAYLGGADPVLVAPARRDDLHGLPPTWIGVGTRDLFHDEDLAYARRLSDAGVPVTFDTVPGAFHGFDIVAPKLRVSREFLGRQCEILAGVIGTW
jgi:acetyl esterase/lipase